MQRRLLVMLLDQGYVQGRSELIRKMGLHMLSHYLGSLDTPTKQAELRAVLLELHAKQHQGNVQLEQLIH